ncbi:MAG: alpha/beta fold hydrolase [Dehalococcoidia bacterium]
MVAGCGAGTVDRERFLRDVQRVAQRMEAEGMEAIADTYARGPTRLPFLRKDPRGWSEFRDEFASHSALGSACTFRGVQLKRPTVFQLEDKLTKLQVPTLIVIGDEDEPCVEPAIFMKRKIPSAGLAVFPQTGHTLNLEEPDLFNRAVLDFLTTVEAGSWAARADISTSLLPQEERV